MAKRRHSESHPGVSVKALPKGRYRLRWRELASDGKQVSQSWTVARGHASEAEEWAIRVYREVQASGTFVRPEAQAPVQPVRPEVADLRLLLVQWLTWKKSHRRIADSTVNLTKSGVRTILRHLGEIGGVEGDQSIPVTVLTVEACEGVVQRLGEHVGLDRQAKIMSYLYEAWAWASDEPKRWPGLEAAPRVRSKVVPRSAPPKRPPPAPTWAEMDAVIRHCAAGQSVKVPLAMAVQRCTGLRAGQVCALRVKDVHGLDSPVPTLDIRTGKSALERMGRTVPVAPVLVPLLRQLVAGKEDGELLIGLPVLDRKTLVKAFERAESAGEIRPVVWRPDGRDNRRTSHCFRACLQRELRRAGVEDRVIDVLVGHHGRTVRDAHYDAADWEELVEAVRQVPEINWEGAAGGKVIELRRPV